MVHLHIRQHFVSHFLKNVFPFFWGLFHFWNNFHIRWCLMKIFMRVNVQMTEKSPKVRKIFYLLRYKFHSIYKQNWKNINTETQKWANMNIVTKDIENVFFFLECKDVLFFFSSFKRFFQDWSTFFFKSCV